MNTAIMNCTTITCGNTAVNPDTGCKRFDIVRTVHHNEPRPARSAYTSQGKHKATPSDPIRSLDDIRAIANHLKTTGIQKHRLRNYTLFVLGISIGVRGGDLLRLTIGDVLNPDNSVRTKIDVYESKTAKMNHPVLNETARAAIKEYTDAMPYFNFSDYLFSTAHGYMKEDTLYKLLMNTQATLKLPYHMGTHCLRKTFAYWNIALHPDDLGTMTCLMEMLNHSDMRSTLHYAGQTVEKHNQMYHDMNKVFDNSTHDIEHTPTLESKIDQLLSIVTGSDD